LTEAPWTSTVASRKSKVPPRGKARQEILQNHVSFMKIRGIPPRERKP